jgi:hypothetical protein
MRQPQIDDSVRLTRDVPEYGLARGTVGIVRSTWFAPIVAYEVEFEDDGSLDQTRVLLDADQVELTDSVLLGADVSEDAPLYSPG